MGPKLGHHCACRCPSTVNTLRPKQDGRHFPNDIFKCIFLNENAQISLKKSLKFVPKVWINNIPALVQIMAWRRSGDKPLSEPTVFSFLTHIWVTLPQWVKPSSSIKSFTGFFEHQWFPIKYALSDNIDKMSNKILYELSWKLPRKVSLLSDVYF